MAAAALVCRTLARPRWAASVAHSFRRTFTLAARPGKPKFHVGGFCLVVMLYVRMIPPMHTSVMHKHSFVQ